MDCVLSDWGPWGTCSTTCGDNGTHTREREENIPHQHGGAECLGSKQETENCPQDACPGRSKHT